VRELHPGAGPADLLHPRSAISGSTDIEIRGSKHLFLRQSLFSAKLRAWIEGKRDRWPLLVTSIALKWLDEGCRTAASRGTWNGACRSTPSSGAEPGRRDAGHRGSCGQGLLRLVRRADRIHRGDVGMGRRQAQEAGKGPADEAEWERWWREPVAADVTYVEFMGKDNVPFHTVGFPAP